VSPSETLKSCAERLAHRPGDPEAIAVLEQLLTSPDRAEAARYLVPAYEKAAASDKLLNALTIIADATVQPLEQLACFKRMARVYRDLKQPTLALPVLTKAIAISPPDPALYRFAEEVALEANAVAALAEQLSVLSGRLPGASGAAAHKALAGLAEKYLNNMEGAISHLRAALQLRPNDVEALEALKRHHEQRREWAALADVTESLAAADPDQGRRVELWRTAAALHETKLKDDERALQCWLKVLELKPADPEGIEAARGLAAALDRHAVQAQILDRARGVAKTPQYEALSLLRAELAAQHGDRATAQAICHELKELPNPSPRVQALLDELDPPGNPTEKLLATLSIFHLAKDRAAMLPELKKLAGQADAREEVADAVEEESESVESPAELTALLRFVALLREELGEPERAVRLWNDLLAVQAHDSEALEHLARLLAGLGDSRNAAEVSLRRGRLAKLGADRHARFVEAADYLIKGGATAEALAALDESLSRPAPVEAADAVGAVQLRRGKLLEASDPNAAVAAYGIAIHAPALEAQAAEGLERLLTTPARAAAAAALEPYARRSASPDQLAAVLEVRSENPEQLMELAALREKAGHPRRAFAAVLRAFELKPADYNVRAELERLGAKEDVLAAYEDVIEQHPKLADAWLLRRVAELHDALGHRDQAFEAWEFAAEAAPHDTDLLRAYAEKCRARGDLARLARVMRWQINATGDQQAKLKLTAQLATLCDDSLADYAGAAQAYQELLQHQPNDLGLLKTLERLYAQTQNNAGLMKVLEKRLKHARESSPGEVVTLALKLGRMLLEPPVQGERALELLREVLQRDAANAQAVAALAQLASTPGPAQAQAAQLVAPALDKLGDYGVVVQILEAQLPQQTGAKERAVLLHRIAEMQAGPMKEPELGFLAITRALREVPDDPAMLQRCLELGEAAGAGDDLDDLLDELARAQPAGRTRASLFRALARRLDGKGEAARAGIAWAEVVSHAPHDSDAQQRVIDQYERDKRYGELAALWQKRADASSVTERPAALLALAAAQEKANALSDAASTLLTLFALTKGADALIQLERVLGVLGRHQERAETLRRLASLSPDTASKVSRMLQQGRVLLTAQETAQAVTAFGEVLALSPSEPRAVAELVPLVSDPAVGARAADLLQGVFKAPGQERQRIAVLEGLLETNGVPGERTLRTELSTLHEALGNPTQAFAGRLRLVTERPEDGEARAALERLVTTSHLEEDLVAAYEDLLERPQDPAVALALRRTVAAAYEGALKRPDLAVAIWEQVSKADRMSLDPLKALARLHLATQDWVRLGAVLNRQVALLKNPAEALPVLRELATLAVERLHDKLLAADTFKKILEHVPGDAQALRALGEILEGAGNQREAAQMLERELKLTTEPIEAAALELRLGKLAMDKPAEALDWFSRALKHRWLDAEAVAGLEALLLRETSLRPRVAEVLEPVYREKKDGPKLAEALELQVSAAAPARQLALLDELAALRESLGDLKRAFSARQELYRRIPEEARGRAELERLAQQTGQLETLAMMFRERLSSDPPEAVELWTRLARIQPSRASEAWEEVARRQPDDAAALETLCALYESQGQYGQLPRLLNRRIELATQDPDKVRLLRQLAELCEQDLGDLPQAVEAHRAALKLGDLSALPPLERLLESSGRFDELCDLLQWRIDQTGDLDVTARLAHFEHHSRNDDGRALFLLKQIFEREPGHSAALRGLEEILQSERAAAAEAALVLEPYYVGKPDLQIEALEVRVTWTPAGSRADLLHRIADLHEGEVDEAFAALARLLRESPDDERALKRVFELSIAPAELAALLTEISARAQGTAAKLAMLTKLARLREKLGQSGPALEAWRAVLELEPDHVDALKAASRLLEASAQWPAQLEMLERRLKLSRDDDERAELLERIGMLRDDSLADAPGAHATFRQLLELRPDDANALLRLDSLCERLERWDELAEVLGRRLKLPHADHDELMLRLAHVRRAKLHDATGALPLLGEILHHSGARNELEQLVADTPELVEATDLLLNVYRKASDAGRLAALLDSAAGTTQDVTRRRALWTELADVRLQFEDDAELAFLALAKAYRESPADAALRTRLIALADKSGEHEALAALLDEVMQGLERGPAAEVALALAALCLGPVNEPERSVSLYRRAMELEADTSPRALEGLDRSLERLQQWAELLPVLEARLTPAQGHDRLALLLRIGAVCADHLDQPTRAIEAYRDVLSDEPAHLSAARALERLYEANGQPQELRDTLETLISLVPGSERQAVRLKLARLCVESDGERTIALCREMLGEDPLHADAFALLADLFEKSGRLGELDGLLKSRLAVTLGPKDAAELELRLGELHWRRLKDGATAAPHYRAVLDRDVRHLRALEALSEIYEAQRAWRDLAQVLSQLAAVRDDLRLKRAHQVRRAEVLTELNEKDGAVAAARAALDLKPDAEPEAERLRAVLVKHASLAEAARAVALLAELRIALSKKTEAVQSLLELAGLEQQRRNDSGVAAALEKILSLEPTHRAAYDQVRALYNASGNWAAWAAASARFLPNLKGDERLDTLDALAEVHARSLGDAPGAFGFAIEAVGSDPHSAPRRETLEGLGRQLHRMEVVATTYRDALEELGFDGRTASIVLALAAVEDEQLNQVDAAERALNRLLERDPAHAAALDALSKMFERRGMHDQRAATLERKLAVARETAAKTALLQEISKLHEEKRKDLKAAADALHRLLDGAPSPANARLIADLHQRHAAWIQMRESLLTLRGLLQSGPERAVVQLEIAELTETKLNDLDGAIAAYSTALEIDANSSSAFRALERLYGKLNRPDELLHAFEHRIAHTNNVDEKIELQFKSAALWEQKSSPLQADRCFEAVVKLRPQEVRALEGLERLRRAGSRWRPLVDALTAHVNAVKEPPTLATLCTELGEVHLTRLRESKMAARWWEKALEHVADHRPAMHALAVLYDKESQSADAVRLYEREAALEAKPFERAELEHRAGVICEENLRDFNRARAAYGRALKAERVHLPSLRRMRSLFLNAQDWKEYEANLTLEAQEAKETADRSAAALELAKHYDKRIRDVKSATRWYGISFSLKPDAVDAALPLADLLFAEQSWIRAAEVLSGVVSLLEKEKPVRNAELVARLCRLAEAQRKLNRTQEALEAYGRALQRDPTEPTALRGQVDVLQELGHAAQAADKLELFLDHHERELKRIERGDLRLRLAQLYWGQNLLEDADRAAGLALEADPALAAALKLLIEITDKLNAFERSATYRQRLAAIVGEEERYRLFVDLGDLCAAKLNSPPRSIDAYTKALQLRPKSKEALEKLFTAYKNAGHNKKAAETLALVLDHPELLESDRRKQTLALADLLGRAMGEIERAADVLEMAIDRSPEFVEAVQALEAMLAKARSWQRLDSAYQKMIRRQGDKPETLGQRATLWRAAGELRGHRLKDKAGALQAFETGAKLLPDDAAAQEAFAEAALEQPERVKEALAAYLRALPTSPQPQKICAAFASVAEKAQDADSMYLAQAAGQVFAGGPEPKHAAQAQLPPRFRAPMSERAWRDALLHPSMRGPLGELMTLLWETWSPKYAREPGDFKLNPKKHAIDLGSASHPVMQHLAVMTGALGFRSLGLLSPYLAPQSSSRRETHPDDGISLRVLPTAPMSLVVGEKFVTERDGAQLYAQMGFHLAQLRPELALAAALQPEELQAMVEAALSMGAPSFNPTVDQKLLKTPRKQLEKTLSDNGRIALQTVAARYLQVAQPNDLRRYLDGVRLTPLRAAVLVSGSFAAVKALFTPNEPAVRALLRFALDGELHALRVATGTALVARSP
jgi:tetratricopeptide (TPR) repeat protein